MSDIHSISGYTPERLVDALHVMQETDATALIFKGMVSSIHEPLVAIHGEHYMNLNHKEPNLRFATGEVIVRLAELGIDVMSYDEHQLLTSVFPTSKASQTNVDLVEPNKTLSWHHDVVAVSDKRPKEVYLPDGVSVSMNLIAPVKFSVDLVIEPLPVDNGPLTNESLRKLIENSSYPYLSKNPLQHVQVQLLPGDAIFWKQPANHKVDITHPKRRAIVLIKEDLVEAP